MLVGMLVLVLGGGRAWDGCCLKVGGGNGPFLKFGLFVKGSGGSVLARGHFLVLACCRKGSQGSAFTLGLLLEPTSHRKESGGVPSGLGALFRCRSPLRRVWRISTCLGAPIRAWLSLEWARRVWTRLCLVRKAPFGGDYVMGHGTFVTLPTIMRWGTVGSVLGGRFNLNSLD